MLHGVDFSGASQAGHDIWIAETTIADDRLVVEHCESAADRFGVAERAPCLGRLCEFLREAAVVGLDFPFGLPAPIHDCDTWEASLEWMATAATDADAFADVCRSRAEEMGAERTQLLRETDGPLGAQSPYGPRIKYQTFHGIRDVLAPLARTDDVVVRPMQAGEDATTLCEIYPAATLAGLDLPAEAYKDTDERARERRRAIVDGLASETPLEFTGGVRAKLIEDAGGDALDAVVAALATYRARQTDFEPDRVWNPVEGHIYI